MRHTGFLIVAGACAVAVFAGGCSAPTGDRAVVSPTIEPLTETEFDAFTSDIADQLLAWLERSNVRLPVTIAPPTIDKRSAERRGVARAFSTRLAGALSDRLLGAVRFGSPTIGDPRIRCELAFAPVSADQAEKTVEFRMWCADSNTEICRWTQDYRPRPRQLNARPAEPAPARITKETAPPMMTVAKNTQPPSSPPPPPPRAASTDARHSKPPATVAHQEGSPRAKLLVRARQPRRRPIRIDRCERGLGELVAEQAPHYQDRTLRRAHGRIVFLDRRSWEGLRVVRAKVTRDAQGRLGIEMQLQARQSPVRADIRVIYLGKDGKQLEASAVRTFELSPGFAKRFELSASETGATSYIMLVARG